ncbi:MAG: uroporphyrinogen-III C-methyltransferase [Verrucomicrobiota bacterium]
MKGIVHLVGAGPGAVGLLTLRGAELLRRADVVVSDMLVNPRLLDLAPPGAERISRGNAGSGGLSQQEINELLIARARDGKRVVRLKGGDPYVFGRGAEEAEALAAAKIPFEVVPGVSSITAVPNYAGIPLTHRACCSSFTVLTGNEDPEKGELAVDFQALAKVPGTRVILMGLRRLEEITSKLLAAGAAPETPAAVIQQGTLGRQVTVEGTLATIAGLAAEKKLAPPALTVIGDVLKFRPRLDWFEHLPLFGRRIVVTRARAQAGPLCSRFAELGAEVLEIPSIRTEPTDRKEEIIDALLELNAYDWLVFTSANGVDAFFGYYFKRFQDLRDLGGARIAAVGPATAARLQALHLQIDLMPKEALGVKIAAEFQKFESIENLKICLLRAQDANPDLPRALEALGGIVDDIAVYKTVAEAPEETGAAAELRERGADWITFTSGSTVKHFHDRFDLPGLVRKFPGLKLASIGPETSQALEALGLKPALEAKQHTGDGLVEALLKAT